MLSIEAINAVSNHPAFDGLDEEKLIRINKQANEQLAAKSVGNQIPIWFQTIY